MKKITRRSMLKGSAVAAAALALSACGGSSSSTLPPPALLHPQPAQLPLTTSASPRRRPSRWQFPARQAADPIWRSVTIVRA